MKEKNSPLSAGKIALYNAFLAFQRLGEKGKSRVKKNQFGETAMLLDIEAEKAVIDTCTKLKIPIRIISEEHGTTNITSKPRFLGVLDGLDGSSNYKKGQGRYATMFGIFSNTSPSYSDYLFSGILEHKTGILFFAAKGHGSFLVESGKKRKIHCSSVSSLDEKTRIHIDEYWDFNRKTFSEKLKDFSTDCLGCSAAHYIDLASGQCDLVLECTRKGNLEIAVAYGLIKEAGGVVLDSEGNDIGNKLYFKFGQDTHLPVISAATQELGKAIIQHIK